MFNTAFNTDFTKLFDSQAMAKNMQQFMDFSSAAKNGKQNLETFKKISGILADTYSTCAEKQMKMAQDAMEDCAESMRDFSSAKGVEDVMARQTEWTRKCAEKAQNNAQELAEVMQKGQSQCTDIIGKMMMASMEWSKAWSGTTTNNVQK
jgi:phasin family protein